MSGPKAMIARQADAARYEIQIQGHLEPWRLDCFADLQLRHQLSGETSIEGTLDPSALHGLLNHLYNLGATLLSVQRIAESKKTRVGTSPLDLPGL
jgi:hypothetical protein